jgi:serine/threonine protein kinase
MQAVGQYKIDSLLGRGATASVFKAHLPTQPDQPVALKVFHPGLWDQPENRRRARAEFDTAARLNHPSIVRVVEALWDNDPPAFVLEYVDGESLETFQSRLPYMLPELSILVVLPVLEALQSAHDLGIFHRDLKPANILIGRKGRVAITDFGLAKITDVSRLTLSGALVGSPDFMSPEQARGDLLSPSSDVFAVAAILYYLVTGTRPFSRGSPLATLAAVLEGRVEAPQNRNPKLSPRLAQLILQGLSVQPEKRPASAQQYAERLRGYLKHVGFPGNSLQDWVEGGSAFTLEALSAMAATLKGRCEKSLRSQQGSDFSADLSHLGAVAPESDSVAQLLREADALRRSRQFRKRTVPAVAALLLLIAAGGATWFVQSRSSVDRVPVTVSAIQPAAALAIAPAAQAPPQAEKVDTAVEKPVQRAVPKKVVLSKPREVATTSPIRIDLPAEVRMYWNGQRVDPKRGLPQQKVGFHELRLEKDGLPPIVQKVQVKAGEPTIIRAR